jgi:hypothetical protein
MFPQIQRLSLRILKMTTIQKKRKEESLGILQKIKNFNSPPVEAETEKNA